MRERGRSGTREVARGARRTAAYSGPPNRIVERDPWSREVEIWHAHDAGDWRELVYELPKGLRKETVEKAFRYYGVRWIEWLERQGWSVNASTITCAGPLPCLELDKLDCDQYVVRARCRRTRPDVRTLDDAQALFEMQPVAGSVVPMFRQTLAVGAPGIERNARASRAAQQLAPAIRAEQDAVQAWRRSKGLPLYDETKAGLPE